MRTRRLIVLLIVLLAGISLCRGLVLAGEQGPVPLGQADAKILAEIAEHSEAMANLEYLSDRIGPRLTGSAQLKQANEWTAKLFTDYGLTGVHLESWTISSAWTRGTARAKILAPAEHPLTIASAGWAPGTGGIVRGPVVYFEAKTKEEFEKFHGKLKGAVVIYQEPASLSPPRPEDPEAELLRPMQAPPPLPGRPPAPSPFAGFAELARARNEFFKAEGVGAVLRDSGKPHGLLNMTGVGGEKFEPGAIPSAFITGEGYRLLYRLLKHGKVEVEIEIANSFSDHPVEVYNTVGEIRGSQNPDEVVMLGAHLDSWDLGTGSTDDGTGTAAVLEAARALVRSGLRPKRTIRFVLFSGEEQGLVGSARYVEAHKAELDKISGILVHDTGTGRVLTIGLHDNYQDRELVDRVIAPLSSLKLLEPTLQRQFGTDHASFNNAGVPGFWVVQTGAEYNKTHHSQSDTFDKVWKDDLNQGAQVLAAWAYNTAELPALLPRRPVPERPAPGAARTEKPAPDPVAEFDSKILEQASSTQEEMKADLQYLTDRIGPRLTGSPQMELASRWTLEKFKQLGLSAVHLEPFTIAHGWLRGPATGRIVSPALHELTLATAGWSASTKGKVQGTVVGIEAERAEELEKYRGKLKGAIVIVGRPRELAAPGNPLRVPWGEESLPIALPKQEAGKPFDPEALRSLRRAQSKFFADEGVAALLTASEKWDGLLNMGSTGRDYQSGAIPTAFMAREELTLLWRLLDRGSVEAEVSIEGRFSENPVEVYNTVGEIPGTEKPDELVLIGAHLDSWDLGSGATDNGTGSAAVIEAARTLQKLGVKPKRTIRFVLFAGEEQGLNGSKAYVKAHSGELSKLSGVLVHDSGTGKVLTVGLMGNYASRETMDRVLYPVAGRIGLFEPTLRSEGGSDHIPFDAAGVPGFWCVQDPADYDKTHHSQADTLDRVRWDDLTEGAQVLAVFAYNVAELPELLPRKAPARPAD